MHLKLSSRLFATVAVSATVAVGAAGCGSSSSSTSSNTTASSGTTAAGAPNYCQKIDDLRSQISSISVKDLTSLQSKITTIQSDVSFIQANAQKDFSSQAQAVQTAQQNLSAAVSKLSADHSISNLTAAATDGKQLSTAVQNLYNAAQATCNK